MAASSSAKACALTASSMPPLACVSKRVDAAAVPNEELVEERADTALFTFFWLLFFVFFFCCQIKNRSEVREACVWYDIVLLAQLCIFRCFCAIFGCVVMV